MSLHEAGGREGGREEAGGKEGGREEEGEGREARVVMPVLGSCGAVVTEGRRKRGRIARWERRRWWRKEVKEGE
jgi:hypothetical protein